MKILLLALCLCTTPAQAQKDVFKEIKLKPDARFYNTKEATIIYPVLATGNKRIDQAMNNTIKKKLLVGEDEKAGTAELLQQQINEGLINMSYFVTYKNQGLLSLNIFTEACGAYCSSFTSYFNFNLQSGKALSASDIIVPGKLDSFAKIIFKDKQNFIAAYKKELEENLIKKEIDSASYRWAVEQVDINCMRAVQMDNFSLSGTGMEFTEPCEFPHAIRALEPGYHLKYNYHSIAAFLKPDFKIAFLKSQ